ncbi:MAG: hypothetical protein ABR559_06115 [Gemmatimonadota bacterium]
MTRWNRLAVRLQVPAATGVYLLGTGSGRAPENVVLIGSARNLRIKLLELLEAEPLQALSARVVHWVAGLTDEQARLAERLFIRRYNPPLNAAPTSRYFDILTG